jgi:hypothetical protein
MITRAAFCKGNPNNRWQDVVPDMAARLGALIGEETRSMIECNFSNTSDTDRFISQIVLMDVCKHFYDYQIYAGCGIPWIELSGTVEDWASIGKKLEMLRGFETEKDPWLGKWIGELSPIIEHFVRAADGKPDIAFWGSVCNLAGLSGMKGKPVTGWISAFFPYLKSGEKNSYLLEWRTSYDFAAKNGVDRALNLSQEGGECGNGVALDDFPSGLSNVPITVVWANSGDMENLTIYGGLVGLYQREDGALDVRNGWAVTCNDQLEDDPFA